MNADRLFALYDRVAEAPDAVARLRRFVLDLAVRGKLVEQDPSDEPATELLKRVAAQKARLVKAGQIRKLKRFEVVDEPSYDLPSGWSFVALGSVLVKHLGGGTPSKRNGTYWGGLVRWASVKDVGKSKYLDDTIDRITEAGLENSSSNLIEPGNLLVVTRMGLGKVSINRVAVAINQDLRALFLSDLMSVDYAYNFFLTHDFEGTGLTVKGIKLKELLSIPFPLPPLAEQQRIVTKVDELMAVCDQLEEARTAREDTRDRLTKASLARLAAPDIDAPTFRSHALFAVDALPALTARADQIKHLRQTILNLAVRGKLVAQDPVDEPASELLKRIAEEKARLLRTRKIRRHKSNESLSRIELGFGLPSGWAAARFSDVVNELQTGPFGSSLHQSDYEIGGTPVINPASIKHGRIVPVENMAIGDDTLERLATFKLRAGDIVMGRRGEMGRCAVVAQSEEGWLCGTGSLILRLSNSLYPQYLAMLIGSPNFREYLRGHSVGATMQNLNQSILLKMSIGLPPLAEQYRIVAKVDELMVFCDGIEVGLDAAAGARSCLLESLLHAPLVSDEVSITGRVH